MIIPVEFDGKIVDGGNSYNSLPDDKKKVVDDYLNNMDEALDFNETGICSFTIPSKAVRDYCRGKITLTTRQKGTLVFNNPYLEEDICHQLYGILIEDAHKEGDELTERQLRKRLETEKKQHKMFFEPGTDEFYRNEKYCYSYRICESEWVRDVLGHFSNFEKAKEAALKDIENFFKKPVRFDVIKYYLDSEKEIVYRFNEKGNALSGYSTYFEELDCFAGEDNPFEDEYVQIPYPFRKGDFVRTIGDEEIGIFAMHENEGDYEKYQKKMQDFMTDDKYMKIDVTDMSVRAEYYDPGTKSFSHNHPAICTLEYAEITDDMPHSKVLKAASDLMKGCGSIEVFQYYLEEDSDKKL